MYYILIVLILLVVFVNGFTDAPNAITCIVSTGALPYKKAVKMAAVFNLLGVFVMCLINTSVAQTITNIIEFDNAKPQQSISLLCAAMLAIIIFAVVAWYFGIPTSESHALIAALTGAAFAQNNIQAINMQAWSKVLYGLVISLVLGFGFGWCITKILGGLLRKSSDKTANSVQIYSGAAMAFMHGAQDGQKFIAVFVMADFLFKGNTIPTSINLYENIPIMLICAVVLFLGTLTGGRRIIECVGGKMVGLKKYQGACADIGGALCLLFASLFGIPMSTTHTKTTAIMGAGLAGTGTKIDINIVKSMFVAWVFTFPICGMIGYLVAIILI